MSIRTICFLFVVVLSSLNAAADIRNISAIINSGQEVPAPTGLPASAAGFALFHLDDVSNELSWNIAWQDLSGAPTGMHIHGPAGPGSNAGVLVNVGDIGGLASPSSGSTTIAGDVAANLLSGETYLNIHTSQNGPGEIRGQINPANSIFSATLDSGQEVPTPVGVPGGAGGSAQVAYDATTNTLGWRIEWEGLTGPATGMHFHGPAGFGETGGVLVNVGNISGLTSPSIGSTVIDDEVASHLANGQLYLNVHTAANGPGEIRGQLVPEPGCHALMLVVVPVGLFACRRRLNRC